MIKNNYRRDFLLQNMFIFSIFLAFFIRREAPGFFLASFLAFFVFFSGSYFLAFFQNLKKNTGKVNADLLWKQP